METSPQALWAAFQRSFCAAIQSLEGIGLAEIWATQYTRTSNYADELLKSVAKDLELDFKREYSMVDYSMWDCRSNSEPTPVIFIESENHATGADHEVKTLCCLAAPLKVLITVGEWEDVIPRWRNGGHRSTLVTRWRSIRSAYHEAWPDPGVLGVLVGESDPDGVLRFHGFELDAGTASPVGDRVLLELPTVIYPIAPAGFRTQNNARLTDLQNIGAVSSASPYAGQPQ
jgi:hypothetical protein